MTTHPLVAKISLWALLISGATAFVSLVALVILYLFDASISLAWLIFKRSVAIAIVSFIVNVISYATLSRELTDKELKANKKPSRWQEYFEEMQNQQQNRRSL